MFFSVPICLKFLCWQRQLSRIIITVSHVSPGSNCLKCTCVSVATKTPTQDAPLLGRGALCADSMGLVWPLNLAGYRPVLTPSQGKTLTMLSLILATKGDVPPDFSKTTLIGKSRFFLAENQSSQCSSSQSFLFPWCPTGRSRSKNTVYEEFCLHVFTMAPRAPCLPKSSWSTMW